MKLIGLCSSSGPGSGKSTIAKALVEVLGDSRAKIVSFATPVKMFGSAILQLLGYDPAAWGKDETFWSGPKALTPRDIYITIGQEGRKIDPDIWVKLAETAIKQMDAEYVIIDDVRFANEVNMIQRQGGLIFNIKNPMATAEDVGNINWHDIHINTVFNSKGLSSPEEVARSIVETFGL